MTYIFLPLTLPSFTGRSQGCLVTRDGRLAVLRGKGHVLGVLPLHGHGCASEQPLERLAKLLAHAAVDEEVQRVAEEDEEVGEEGERVEGGLL